MLDNLIIKNTTKCDCGREFIIQDIEKLQRIEDSNFYQGVVKHYSKATCPNCRKEVILLLKQVGQTYKVINVAEQYRENVKEEVKNDGINVKTEVKTDGINVEIAENTQIETTIENKEQDHASDELICPECKRAFKNKAGLTNHMKTHQN